MDNSIISYLDDADNTDNNDDNNNDNNNDNVSDTLNNNDNVSDTLNNNDDNNDNITGGNIVDNNDNNNEIFIGGMSAYSGGLETQYYFGGRQFDKEVLMSRLSKGESPEKLVAELFPKIKTAVPTTFTYEELYKSIMDSCSVPGALISQFVATFDKLKQLEVNIKNKIRSLDKKECKTLYISIPEKTFEEEIVSKVVKNPEQLVGFPESLHGSIKDELIYDPVYLQTTINKIVDYINKFRVRKEHAMIKALDDFQTIAVLLQSTVQINKWDTEAIQKLFSVESQLAEYIEAIESYQEKAVNKLNEVIKRISEILKD